MMKFQEFRTQDNLSEAAKVVKTFKVGAGKYTAEIKKNGSKFVASIDGQDLDTFKNEKDAEKAIKDFTKLMGK